MYEDSIVYWNNQKKQQRVLFGRIERRAKKEKKTECMHKWK